MSPIYPKVTRHDILRLMYHTMRYYPNPTQTLDVQHLTEALNRVLLSQTSIADSTITRFDHAVLYAVKNNVYIAIACRHCNTGRLSSCEFFFDITESVVRVFPTNYYSAAAQQSISQELSWDDTFGTEDCKFDQLLNQYADDISSQVNHSIACMYSHKIPTCDPIITREYHNEKSHPFLI